MTIQISRATTQDAELLGELGRSTYRTYFGDIWGAAAFADYLDKHFDLARLRADMAGEAVRYYLARSGGQVRGYAKLVLDRPIPGTGAPAAELEKLYLLPEAIGTGLGVVLLDHVLADAAGAGFSRVWLDVLKTNERAQRAYERAGFVRVGELPFATDTHDIGFWVMARGIR